MVETIRMTANDLQLTASVGLDDRSTPEPLAASREPMARPDALVHELYGLTEVGIRIMVES